MKHDTFLGPRVLTETDALGSELTAEIFDTTGTV